ncbi:hypothetical protein TNCV_4313851 [Trichonephila clavipes]|nr:hypothetical protein TNCV_4313851 [Trichonephila clavipes]
MIAGAYSQNDGRNRKIHEGNLNKYRKLPQKAGKDDVPQRTSVQSKQSAGGERGGNAGRKTGRPEAVNQFGDHSPQNPK